MAEKEIAVKVQDLTKSFRIPLEASNGLKQKLINFLKGRKGYRDFTPLDDVSFEIEKGDFFGIVGRNGSGKSTLLKTIAGIYTPNKGAVLVNGTLVPFIELGVGFNPELTGRENVFLNGALLGFSHAEMEVMYDDIVDFAELYDFMDERLKNYSSGMQVRLAFSIAIKAQGDILLLDEVLAVGDEAFQRKCYDYFDGLRRQNKTVILVTHDMVAVERFCNRAMLIEKGKAVFIGGSSEVAKKYKALFANEADDNNEDRHKRDGRIGSVDVSILQNNQETRKIKFKTPYSIRARLYAKESIGSIGLSLVIVNSQGIVVMSMGVGGLTEDNMKLHKGDNEVSFDITRNILNNDTYSIGIIIESNEGKVEKIYENSLETTYTIYGNKYRTHALIHPELRVRVGR